MNDVSINDRREFRVNKGLFYICIASSIILSLLLVGIPMFIYFIIWYKTTSVTISGDGLDYRTGWLVVKKKHIPYDRINSIDIKVDVFGNWLGYGDIEISTGNDLRGLTIRGVDGAEMLKDRIRLSVKEVRASAS